MYFVGLFTVTIVVSPLYAMFISWALMPETVAYHGASEVEMLVHFPVHTAECLQMTVEIVCLVDIGVGLTEVAEAGPEFEFRANHITGIEFHKHLRHFCHDIASGIDLALISVAEFHRCLILLVSRFLICEESMQLKSLERTHHSICCPSLCLYVVCHWSGHNLLTVLKVECGVVVGLGDIREERCQAEPTVVVIYSGTSEWNDKFALAALSITLRLPSSLLLLSLSCAYNYGTDHTH